MSEHEAVVRPAGPWRTTADAEHHVSGWWQEVPPVSPVVLAATHFLPGHTGVGVTVEHADGHVAGLGTEEADHLAWIVDHHVNRTGGRLFHFPGSQGLVGTTAVGALLGLTAVDEVVGIGLPAVDPATTLHTQGFVRPAFADGRIRLLVRPAAGGSVVPFEQPNPTPCCAEHG